MASKITSLTIVYSTVYSDADQRKHQSSASLASVRGIHRGPVNFPHQWPVTWKMFPFDDVIMINHLPEPHNVDRLPVVLDQCRVGLVMLEDVHVSCLVDQLQARFPLYFMPTEKGRYQS